MLGGDPDLDREVQREINQRSRWRRDLLLLLAGFLVVLVIVALVMGP